MLYRVGKTWYIDIGSARGRLRRSAHTEDRRQAQAFHDRVKNEIWRQEQLGEKPRVTWGQAVEKWKQTRNPGQPDVYRIDACGVEDDALLPLTTVPDKAAPSSWNRLLAIVAVIHKVNGFQPPDLPRKPVTAGRTRYLTAKEWAKFRPILKAESPLLEQAASFALATGLRENNVLNLEWSQVDLKRRLALLHPDQVKNRSTLGVPLNDDAVAVLKARRGLHRVWVFAHPDSGKPLYKASNKAWYEALRKAKLVGLRWHDLRHTWASWAIMSGVSLAELQELGGWKTLSMVSRYAHLSKDHLRSAANKIHPV